MVSPFPGMDPYLENPEIWPGFHLLLIAALAESLSPQLRPKYFVSVEVRMYEIRGEQSLLVGIPDVSIYGSLPNSKPDNSKIALSIPPTQPISVTLPVGETVRQGYLEIREVTTKQVVTVIEVLSPINKRPGKGRKTYERKRERVLDTFTHLVEIDLLRAWKPMPPLASNIKSDYRILVSRGECRPLAELHAFMLREAIPPFSLPLPNGEREPIVDLQTLLNDIYDRSAYDLKLDYTAEPLPPLSATDAAWADTLLTEKGLR